MTAIMVHNPVLTWLVRGMAGLGAALLLGAAVGCQNATENFLPVAGKVTLEGKPLQVGTVSFRADTSKGNKTMHVPNAEIDSQGNYELVTQGKKGAPPGWYKVVVFANAHDLVALSAPPTTARPAAPKWMMHVKYTDPSTTPLAIEVVATPSAGAYDLNVTK
jgi:hypothetical protein